MPAYDAWNRAIAAHFFSPEHAGRPAPLAVDDETLKRIACRHLDVAAADALEDFISAVRDRARSWSHFRWFTSRQRDWWRAAAREGPPPSIALLALLVLAASRMERDEDVGVAAHNYYWRLNPLIGRPHDAGTPEGIEALQLLWEQLTQWLDDQQVGALGSSTVRAHHWHTNIGYPISQALLREADRNRLGDFFRSVRLEPGDEISAQELWMLLRNWTHEECGLSSYGVRAILDADARLAGVLAEIVKAEFDAWDGSLRDAEGRRLGEIALRIKGRGGWRRINATLLPRRPDGFPEGAFTGSFGVVHELRPLVAGWYEPLPVPVDRALLDKGLSLVMGRYSLRYEPWRVVPLRASLELGGWVAVNRVAATEEHRLLVHVSKLGAVKAFLARRAEGRREVVEAVGLPPTWRVVLDVRIVDEAVTDDPDLARLTPRFGATARFDGGLRVAPRQYLTGGEPDLWVSVFEGRDIAVELDDTHDTWPGPVKRVPLRHMELAEGGHTVRVHGRTMRFTSFAGFDLAQRSTQDPLAFELHRHNDYRPAAPIARRVDGVPPPGTVHVLGAQLLADPADLPLPVEPPVLLPLGFRGYVLLGRHPGELMSVPSPSEPLWLKLGLDEDAPCQVFDVPCPFEAQVAILTGAAGVQLRTIRRPPLAAETVPVQLAGDAVVGAWKQAIREAETASITVPQPLAATWETYIAQAQATS